MDNETDKKRKKRKVIKNPNLSKIEKKKINIFPALRFRVGRFTSGAKTNDAGLAQ